ncbi:MAG: DUF4097 domain-containing protein [Nocardioidaceae bacterium]|nr:DUF4097 domain-containing protein [Nocardioidaceae bacterium]MCL2612961.1 DUF4097 domain-containing protein [Nocardioidaceae bacterium]
MSGRVADEATAAEHGFDTPKPPTLVVAVRDGRVVVTAADVTTTTVHLSGPRADEVRVEQRGDRIVVIGPKPRGLAGATDVDYEIRAPLDSELVAHSASATIASVGRLGAARVKASSGEIVLDDLSGAGVVSTGSASITVGEVAAGLRVRTGSGRVTVGAATQAAVSTGSGDVRVGRLVGRLVVKSGSGDLEVDDAEGEIAFTTGSGDIVVRRSRGGRITSKGASGDVRIGVADGVAVWTDIAAHIGRISSTLPRMGEPERGAPYVEIRAITATGHVVLGPA